MKYNVFFVFPINLKVGFMFSLDELGIDISPIAFFERFQAAFYNKPTKETVVKKLHQMIVSQYVALFTLSKVGADTLLLFMLAHYEGFYEGSILILPKEDREKLQKKYSMDMSQRDFYRGLENLCEHRLILKDVNKRGVYHFEDNTINSIGNTSEESKTSLKQAPLASYEQFYKILLSSNANETSFTENNITTKIIKD